MIKIFIWISETTRCQCIIFLSLIKVLYLIINSLTGGSECWKISILQSEFANNTCQKQSRQKLNPAFGSWHFLWKLNRAIFWCKTFKNRFEQEMVKLWCPFVKESGFFTQYQRLSQYQMLFPESCDYTLIEIVSVWVTNVCHSFS